MLWAFALAKRLLEPDALPPTITLETCEVNSSKPSGAFKVYKSSSHTNQELYWTGNCFNIVDILKVPEINTFLKLVEQPRNAAKPCGVSKSSDMKIGWTSELELETCCQILSEWSTNSPLVYSCAYPFLMFTKATSSALFSGILYGEYYGEA